MLIKLVSEIARPLNFLGLGEKFVDWAMLGEKFCWLDSMYDIFVSQQQKRLTLLLPGYGCDWFKKFGGCTMCGFGQKLVEVHQKYRGLSRISANDFVGLYSMAEMLSAKQQPKLLYIYNGGSFLNENEIPLQAQLAITKAVSQHSTIRLLFVESRPEFINSLSLVRLTDELRGKTLEIGIGLEAVTDLVRDKMIHKGFTCADYERAVKDCKKQGVKVLTYVFLKPMGLTEAEAINEAVRTIKYAFEIGTDEVSLSCAFIQQDTPMHQVYLAGKFKPPWLWSIIEVIKQTAEFGPVRIGSFNDEPPPIAKPQNCTVCSYLVEKAIDRYNLSRNLSKIENLSCQCRKEWQQEVNNQQSSS
jgi:radical SAM enzyme (TIGR01210 family)